MESDGERPIADELRSREPIFHRTEHGTSRADWEAMTDPAFWEVGASGNVYARAEVLDTVVKRFADAEYDPMDGLEVEHFTVRRLDGVAWLATYLLHQGPRITRRASVWRRDGAGWLLLYHQGTVVDTGA
jgi:hypothetical protein